MLGYRPATGRARAIRAGQSRLPIPGTEWVAGGWGSTGARGAGEGEEALIPSLLSNCQVGRVGSGFLGWRRRRGVFLEVKSLIFRHEAGLGCGTGVAVCLLSQVWFCSPTAAVSVNDRRAGNECDETGIRLG